MLLVNDWPGLISYTVYDVQIVKLCSLIKMAVSRTFARLFGQRGTRARERKLRRGIIIIERVSVSQFLLC